MPPFAVTTHVAQPSGDVSIGDRTRHRWTANPRADGSRGCWTVCRSSAGRLHARLLANLAGSPAEPAEYVARTQHRAHHRGRAASRLESRLDRPWERGPAAPDCVRGR